MDLTIEDFIEAAHGNFHPNWGINSLFMPNEFKQDFKRWFIENAVFFQPPNLVSQEEFDLVRSKLILDIETGLCHGNSQKICLVTQGYSYCEGFYFIDREYDSIVRHSFNVKIKELQLKDFTSSVSNVISKGHLGVIIPTDIVEDIVLNYLSNDLETFLNTRMNRSLLRHFYFKSIGRSDILESVNSFSNPEN